MYIPSLDGIRALSVLIVFFSHAGFGHIVPGGFGVTVFFFLSGYLITTLLLRETAATDRVALGDFYMRRLLRLGPPLILTLGAAAALAVTGVIGGGVDWPTIASQVFFYFNYYFLSGASQPIDGTVVFWSLSVEEHFYFLWPLALAWLWRRGLPLGWVLAFLVFAPIWRFVRFEILGHSFEATYYATDARLDSLLWGCLLAILAHRDLARRLFPGGRVMALWIGASLAGLVFTFLFRDETFRAVIRYTLQGACLLPLFHYAVTRPDLWLFRPLQWAPLKHVGLWSYTIYLAHSVVLQGLVANDVAPLGSPLLIGLGLGLSIAWAAGVFHLVEVPLLPLRRAFAAKKARAS